MMMLISRIRLTGYIYRKNTMLDEFALNDFCCGIASVVIDISDDLDCERSGV
jgi:predicted nucleotide-binding protein (sugar kinase/HSP70/actin superfamily)